MFYGLRDLNEARAYLEDEVLRRRLQQAVEVVAEQLVGGADLRVLMGGEVDALKLVSSLTLFEDAACNQREANAEMADLAASCGVALAAAERQGFPRCSHTLRECGRR